jgi:glycosyltransferase involved in cell wall biosynthesis
VAKALRALAAQTLSKEEFEVIVVSDGSTDDTEAVVERSQRAYSAEVAEATSATKAGRLGNLHFLCQPRRGPAAARNTGIGMARGRFVAFTDDDCIPERDWLRRIMDCFHDHPQALGIEGKTITDAERVTPLTHQVINLRGGRSRPTCNVSYVREALLKVGGFDEGYVFNGEDEDMALAVAEIGTIVFCESAIVVHPPRQMQFRDHLRRIVHLELQAMLCEFRLARKHPAGYRPLRGGGPWWSIFYLTALLRLYELWEGRGWLRKAPASWLAAALLLGLKMLWRLFLVPLTFVKLRSSECLGGAP